VWVPQTFSEVQLAIGSVQESGQLDFKSAVGNNNDIAKDIASMTPEGGVIVYGVDEDKSFVASELTPVPLVNLRERVQQVADVAIRPAPTIEILLLVANPGDKDGVAVVVVPASPFAPHMANDRFPARSGTTTRYLSEPEVERFYEQRRALSAQAASRTPLKNYTQPGSSVPKGNWVEGVGFLRILVEPVVLHPHPAGAWVGQPLRRARQEALETLHPLVGPQFDSKTLEWLERWQPDGVSGWAAGAASDNKKELGDVTLAAASYAYGGGLSFLVTTTVMSNDRKCAYEWFWTLETMACLAFAGSFYKSVPGVSFAYVDLLLQGLEGAVSFKASRGRAYHHDQRKIPTQKYEASDLFSVLELATDPREATRALLERLFASFLEEGDDPVEDVTHGREGPGRPGIELLRPAANYSPGA